MANSVPKSQGMSPVAPGSAQQPSLPQPSGSPTNPSGPPTSGAPVSRAVKNRRIVLASLFIGSFLVLWVVRGQIVQPLDTFITAQQCRSYGQELERPVAAYERSNQLAILGRSKGYCRFGPSPEDADGLQLGLDDIQFGAVYNLTKLMGIILQLGAVSSFIRFAHDPVTEVVASHFGEE